MAKRSKGADGAEDRVEGVTKRVGERSFGGASTGKQVVSIGVQGFGAGAGGGLELGRECWETKLALKEESEEVVRKTVVRMLAGKAVEGETSEGAQERREGDLDVRGRGGESGVEALDLVCAVESVGSATGVGSGDVVAEVINWGCREEGGGVVVIEAEEARSSVGWSASPEGEWSTEVVGDGEVRAICRGNALGDILERAGEGGKEIGDGTGVKVSVSSASERSWVDGDAFSMGRKGVVVLC